MSDNKFIKHLQGENTTKSVLEIKNQRTTTSFANMPDGDTSNANDVYSDHRGNATGVLKGTENWKLDGQNLVETTTVYGDGRDFTDSFSVFGNGLWVDATCTFATARRFSPNTKFVLKLCGHDLETVINHTVNFTLIVKFGTSNLISKTFTVTEQAFDFCKEFAIDFAESNSSTIKVDAGSTMQIQLLCADPAAQAVLYNGMTVFTALQRRVDGDAVASDKKTFDEVVDDVEQLQEDLDDLEEYVDDTFVKKAGDTMSGALNIENIASSNTPLLTLTHSNTATYKWNIAPRYNSTTLSIYPGSTETNGFRFATTGFVPASNNARYLGSASLKWKGVYTAMINNGGDLVVPARSGTLATKEEVDLAANSGRMILDQGVWYAKMYAATVAPSAENGTNYADFSQVDGQGNPIIVIYERQNGAWVQSETITPPAEYDGYVPITSKIWDITEQAGQQGGRILWNHQSKEFTPYPQIISFEDIEVTGSSTVIMPYNPSANQIVNKDYVDSAISSAVGNGTITITQGGTTVGSFTTNQSSDETIALDSGGYHPDLFDWKWADHEISDMSWLRADTFSWQDGTVYSDAYQHLVDDISGKTLQTETVGGTTISFYLADDGHKICPATQESNVTAIYTATGVAWYYILDTDNTRFKLPRTKFGVTGLRDTVGNYVGAGLPNITGVFDTVDRRTNIIASGAFYQATVSSNLWGAQSSISGNTKGVGLDASRSSGVYGGSNTVQPPATQQYLYFYVGQFSQSAIEQTAGLNASLFNNKVDIGHQVVAFQAPNAGNNYTWYRKYADGWVEQGGFASNLAWNGTGTNATITLPITMADSNYTVCATMSNSSSSWNYPGCCGWASSATQIIVGIATLDNNQGTVYKVYWQVSGMAA